MEFDRKEVLSSGVVKLTFRGELVVLIYPGGKVLDLRQVGQVSAQKPVERVVRQELEYVPFVDAA